MIRIEQYSRKTMVCVVLLVLATLYSFMTVFFGLDFRDTFYFGCKYVYGDSIDVFLPAVQGAYIALFKLFGGYILPYRLLNWFLCFAACLLLFYFEHTEIFSKPQRLLSLAIAVLTIPWTSVNVLNGNAFTTLGIVGVYVSMALYYERKRNGWLIGVVAFLVLCLMARFPNVVILVVLFLVIPLLFPKAKERLYLLAVVLLSLSLYIVFNAALFGGIRVFIDELKTAFLFSSEVSSANHSMKYLFSEYLHTLKDIVSDIKYLSLVVAIPIGSYFLKCDNNKKIGYACVLVFTCALLLFVHFRVEVVSDVVNYFLLVMFYSLIFILVFVTMVVSLLKKDWVALGWRVLPVLLSVCAAAGSDSGLILMGGPLGIFCPYIIFIAIEEIEGLDAKKMSILLISLFGLSLGAFFYVREGMIFVGIGIIALLLLWIAFLKEEKLPNQMCRIKINRIGGRNCVVASAISTIVICICLFIYAKMNRTFWDKPVYALNCQHDEKLLKGVLTNTESRDYVNRVMRDYRSISDGKVVFYGSNSMIFSYLTCSGLVPGTDFMQDDNVHNIKALESVVDSTTVLFLCPRNPVVGDFSLDNYLKLDSLLTTKGWQIDGKGDYAIYYAPGILQ